MCFGLPNPVIFAKDDSDLLKDLDVELKKGSEEESLLTELDTELKPKKEEKVFLETLIDNLSGDLRLRWQRFWYRPDDREGLDKKFNVEEIRLKFSSFYNAGDLRLDLSGWIEAGNQDDTYAGVGKFYRDRHRERRYVELNEFYFTYSKGNCDLTLGKKLFKVGISTLYSPTDRHSPREGNDPIDFKDLGIWQGRVDYYIKDISFTFAVLPIFQTNKSPSSHSRWTSSVIEKDEQTDSDFYTLEADKENTEIKDHYPGVKLRNISYYARIKGTWHGWDWFLSTYQGLNPYYVLKKIKKGGKTYYIKKNVFIAEYAGGFSTSYKSWEFHGEVLYNHSYNKKDDDYFNYVGGITYTIDEWLQRLHLKKLIIIVEYAGEIPVHGQKARYYEKSSRECRAGRNDIYSLFRLEATDDLIFKYKSNFELSKGGRANIFISEYRLKPRVKWRTSFEFFNGGKKSYYGRWRKNDRMVMELIYSF